MTFVGGEAACILMLDSTEEEVFEGVSGGVLGKQLSIIDDHRRRLLWRVGLLVLVGRGGVGIQIRPIREEGRNERTTGRKGRQKRKSNGCDDE